MIVYYILKTPFPNVKLDDIDTSFPLLGGSLRGDYEQHPLSEGANDFPPQVRVEIEMVDLYSKGVTEVSSVRCTITYLEDHSKA